MARAILGLVDLSEPRGFLGLCREEGALYHEGETRDL